MALRLRTVSWLVVGLLLLAAGFVGGAYWATQRVPAFYEQALQQDPIAVQQANEKMLARTTTLASSVKREGQWSALFTGDEINGWLAVDLPQNYPDLLSPEISDPRVLLTPGRLTLACRYRTGAVTTVASLELEAYLPEANVVAIRVRSLKAGALPLPLADLLDGVSKAAADMDLRIRWLKADGDPVALIEIPPAKGQFNTAYQLETLDIRDGEVYLSGHTRRIDTPPPPAAHPLVADQEGKNANVHR